MELNIDRVYECTRGCVQAYVRVVWYGNTKDINKTFSCLVNTVCMYLRNYIIFKTKKLKLYYYHCYY